MKIFVLFPQGRSKNMPENLPMDTGHSWDLGSKWYQGYAARYGASGIFVRQKRVDFFLRIHDILYSKG